MDLWLRRIPLLLVLQTISNSVVLLFLDLWNGWLHLLLTFTLLINRGLLLVTMMLLDGNGLGHPFLQVAQLRRHLVLIKLASMPLMVEGCHHYFDSTLLPCLLLGQLPFELLLMLSILATLAESSLLLLIPAEAHLRHLLSNLHAPKIQTWYWHHSAAELRPSFS